MAGAEGAHVGPHTVRPSWRSSAATTRHSRALASPAGPAGMCGAPAAGPAAPAVAGGGGGTLQEEVEWGGGWRTGTRGVLVAEAGWAEGLTFVERLGWGYPEPPTFKEYGGHPHPESTPPRAEPPLREQRTKTHKVENQPNLDGGISRPLAGTSYQIGGGSVYLGGIKLSGLPIPITHKILVVYFVFTKNVQFLSKMEEILLENCDIHPKF